MALILSLETSTRICSVALHANKQLITSAEVHVEQAHATRLASLIKDISRFAGIEITELNAVAVSSGPGSYTGLRIGVSTAKGLCFALGIPLISVNTLKLMAFQMSNSVDQDNLLCPMIDARRMEVYCLITDVNLKEIQPIQAKVIDTFSFKDLLQNKKITFFGDGASKCKSMITDAQASFIDIIYPQALALGAMASEKFDKGEFEDIVNYEPVYLKEFLVKTPKMI
ncbi:MAG: tRNA (adenosine(37)-N6)-threonylcarbamoyltransferase complex dimerization subunit type 1 TsaB [Cyclobacteriaceae bacterium]|nr:tRNA (adenosine(37)-N6)-threonylcarbamoyltransferase complex dimerization subunit type 1 TsaB [Cyclobacteriaceae bacterium]